MDIDHFKWGINDVHGHQFGDQVLIEVAARLFTVARTDDVMMRIQSDEFIVVPGVLRSNEELKNQATQILRLFDKPITSGSISANLGVSIGMAMQEPGKEPLSLLVLVDKACEQSKRNGGGRASLHGSDWEAT
ncbi:MAG TPA: GGDEF domain-containing protein [Acidimicrobiales bacterium]|nr:GGDEF domain-containing protein [Acidimicrobiales bacterium]